MKSKILLIVVMLLVSFVPALPAQAAGISLQVIPARNVKQGESWTLKGWSDIKGQSRFTMNGTILDSDKSTSGFTTVDTTNLPVGVNLTFCFAVSEKTSSWKEVATSCQTYQVEAGHGKSISQPSNPNQSTFQCGEWVAKYTLGDIVKVAEPGDTATSNDKPLNLRELPGMKSKIIGDVPAGTFVKLLEGPVCKDNWIWWKIQHKEKTGWLVERGGSKGYDQLVAPSAEDLNNMNN